MSKVLEEVKGKRLLVLGATGYFCEVVRKAKSMGIYTIVTDYFPDSPAKAIADKAYDVSTVDIDTLERIAKEEKIDGVFVAWSDINHYVAEELCRRLGLPFYATREQLFTFTNKRAFKDCCRRFGVPTVPEYRLTEELLPEDMAALEYPLIVKPADSYSGKGITICNSAEEVPGAVAEALSKSRKKQFLVEKYMKDGDTDAVGIYYTIQDGKAALSSMTDRYMVEFGTKRLNTAIFYPSQYLDRFIREVDPQMKSMLSGMHMQNGVIFFEGCVDADSFYLWESGFRLCGAQQNILPAYINHVDSGEMLICHALTGRMADTDMTALEDPYFKGKHACNGLVFLKPGKISAIEGADQIRAFPGVINLTQLRVPGDEIKQDEIGTLNASFGRFHIVADTQKELFELIDSIHAALHVTDTDGREMCVSSYDYTEIALPKKWK